MLSTELLLNPDQRFWYTGKILSVPRNLGLPLSEMHVNLIADLLNRCC